MQIGTLFLATDVLQVIKTLKEQVANNGIELFAKFIDSGEDIMVCCPYHKGGQERRPSAGIRKADGVFHCLACGETHSLPEVVAHCLGYKDELQGYKWLAQNFASAEVRDRERLKVNFNRLNQDATAHTDRSYVSEEELDSYRYVHQYMYDRGLTDEVIEKFDIGYDKQRDSITFPVRYWTDYNYGKTMFVARRSVKTKYFDLPKSIEKPLYGLFEIGTQKIDKIYVCEGLFDCLRLWANGKYAVAGFGCLFSDYQIRQINGLPTRTIILALDNDEAGEKATFRLHNAICGKIVKEVILPAGRKDIGECTDEEIQNLEEVL